MRIFRILAVIIILAAGYIGYRHISDKKEAEIQKEYQKYAMVISEVSVAAELYRNHPDSFLIVRDSILTDHNITINEIRTFQSNLTDNNTEWSRVWTHVTNLTDSLVNTRMELFHDDILSDSDKTDTDIDSTIPIIK